MSWTKWPATRGTALVLAGVLLLALVPAQGRSDYLDQPLRRYTGYTRPGAPPDRAGADDKMPEGTDAREALGGTIYFAVYERVADRTERSDQDDGEAREDKNDKGDKKLKPAKNDTWGTGIENFDTIFTRGKEIEGGTSPTLDKTARYLYLYQTVNDRGTEGVITSTSVRLLVDPKAITSWGYLPSMGFAARPREWAPQTKIGIRAADFEDREGGIKVRPAIEDAPRGRPQPISYAVTYVSGVQPENSKYRDPAPAVRNHELPVLVRVTSTRDVAKAVGSGIVGVAVEEAMQPVHEPDLTVLDYGKDYSDRPYFRAIWFDNNALKKGDRSSVFGFTSNLPPTYATARLRGAKWVKEDEHKKLPLIPPQKDEEEEVNGGGLSFVGLFQQDAGGSVLAGTGATPAGTAPTPTDGGGGGGAAGVGPLGPLSPLSGASGGGGGGGGGFGGGVPGLGVPTSSGRGGGGGGIGGGGGGNGNNTGTPQQQNQQGQQAQQQQQQGNTPNQSLTQQIVLAIQIALSQNTNVNQNQSQNQNQTQNQNQNPPPPPPQVVPEPAAFILAGMGLTFLLLALRRRRKAAPSDAPA